jgi:FkbM family methyltransferase
LAPLDFVEKEIDDCEDESLSEVVVDDSSLRLFTPWSGVTPAGYWTDFLGVQTRVDVWAFTPEYLEIYNHDRFESPGLPTDGEHVLDWIPLIDAVAGSGHTFVMVALGAGWGRWLSAGAFAARQLARECKLVGVEAEPTHFNWMLRHLAQNGIDPARHRIIRAAASNTAGPCWFHIGGNAAGWYGQSIVPDSDVPPEITAQAPLWSEVSIGDTRLQRVCSVDLRDVVSGLPTIDYMHMDIQGAEAAFLEAYPELLQQHVRAVNVGTHSSQIEDRLQALFRTLKWRCAYDVPLKSAVMVRVGSSDAQRVAFGDGVQVWTNPTLQPANFALGP